MLQNAYFLAKIDADTAENERNFAEILPKFDNPEPFAAHNEPDHPGDRGPCVGHERPESARWRADRVRVSKIRKISKISRI